MAFLECLTSEEHKFGWLRETVERTCGHRGKAPVGNGGPRKLAFCVALSFSSWKILFGANISKRSFRSEVKYSFLCLLACPSSSPPEGQR